MFGPILASLNLIVRRKTAMLYRDLERFGKAREEHIGTGTGGRGRGQARPVAVSMCLFGPNSSAINLYLVSASHNSS